MNRLATNLRSQGRAINGRTLVSFVCCLVLLIAVPQFAQAANFSPAKTVTVTRAALTANSNSLDSNTFNYGLAPTLTNLATSSSRTQAWLNLTNTTAGTDFCLTRTVSVPGSVGSGSNQQPTPEGGSA